MKVHLIGHRFRTGKRITHFKTICGKTRHVFTDLPTTDEKIKVTCKICKRLTTKTPRP